MGLDLSVIIPAYNRVELLKYSLESVKRAIKELAVEVILVDDGSTKPLVDQLKDFLTLPLHVIRQNNQGSIIARSNGLKEARGEYVLFLDSDDLVHEEKLISQISILNKKNADVCYTDQATTDLRGEYDSLVVHPAGSLPVVSHPAEFYLNVQPAPHNPVYRRAYLQKHLSEPLIPEHRIFDPVGDVWLYYNLAIYPAQVVKISENFTIVSCHDEYRYSRHWEKLGAAALAVMLAFVEKCPQTEDTLEARKQVGECAFHSWRRLPKQFNTSFENKLLEIWRSSPKSPLQRLGGKNFQMLAKLIGVENAASLFRFIQRPPYSQIRTLNDEEFKQLLSIYNFLAYQPIF